MNHILPTIFCLMISYVSFAVQVTGNVTLEDESDHSGIKVLFSAASASAVSDSTFTDSNGDYSLNLSAGNYEVKLSKEDYKIIEEGPYFISSDKHFDHGEMEASLSYVILDGNINGTLYADTNYLVIDKATIDRDDTLILEAGAVIYFQNSTQFWINGIMITNSDEESRITFKMHEDYSSMRFTGIYMDNKNVSNEFKYMDIINSRFGIQVRNQKNFKISNIEFINSHFDGIALEYVDSAFISHCNFNGTNTGINNKSSGTHMEIEYCEFTGFDKQGIYSNSGANIRHCRFIDNERGISGGQNQIERNLFVNNKTGIGGSSCASCQIVNNTFYENDRAISLGSMATYDGQILMNCFANNDVDLYSSATSISASGITYNFLDKNNAKNNPVLGAGIPIGVNQKGDSIDTHFNVIEYEVNFYTIDLSSRFAFFPYYESSLVDAGNPNYKDEDGSIRDIGAFAYVSYLSDQKTVAEKNELKVYPNPFDQEVFFDLPENEVFTIQLFDVNGQLMFRDEGVTGRYRLQSPKFEPGMMFYQVSGKENVFTGKLISR